MPLDNYSDYSDSELLRLIAENDRKAFDIIYLRYWKTLFAIAYSHLKETSSCEDIVHDVFASLWYNRSRIEARNLNNYLAAAVKYMVLHTIRRGYRLERYVINENTTSSSPDPENILHYKMILELLDEAIDRLPEKCRLIFIFNRKSGLSPKEIAAEMDISVQTVKNQLGIAVKRLRKNLKNSLHSFFNLLC